MEGFGGLMFGGILSSVSIFLFLLLMIKPGALCIMGKYSTTKLYLQPCSLSFIRILNK